MNQVTLQFLKFWQKSTFTPYYIFFFLSLIVLSFEMGRIGDFRIDDAYISFSYAKNFAFGRGLTYSNSLDIEGYSNFLWIIILSLVQAALPSTDLIFGARVLSAIALMVAACVVFSQCLSRCGFWISLFAGISLCLWTDVIYATQCGLESIFFAACVTLSLFLFTHRRYKAGWYLCLLCSLIRIDGFILFAFALIFRLVQSKDRIRPYRVLHESAIPIALFALYFTIRWNHYGLAFPLPFYAKHHFEEGSFLGGYRYIREFFLGNGILFLIPFITLAYALKERTAVLAYILFLPFYLMYILFAGSDWMNFNRLLLPVVPSILILSATGLRSVWQRVGSLRWRFANTVVKGLSILLASYAVICSNSFFINTETENNKIHSLAAEGRHVLNLIQSSSFLNAAIRYPGDTLVTDYGGVFAYFTQAKVFEMWGLCNREVALMGNYHGVNKIYGKTCFWCYKNLEPNFFHLYAPLIVEPDKIKSLDEAIAQVWQSSHLDRFVGFKRNYHLVRVLSSNRTKAVFLLERKRPGRPYEDSYKDGFYIEYLTRTR